MNDTTGTQVARKFPRGSIVEWATDGETVRGIVHGPSGKNHVNVRIDGAVARVKREKLTIVMAAE